ncbi:MAG TPA: bifunctional oligoribonuclease/PAP phosphatase NrnA [Bacillota bacterium]|nr:bifunctional oligoribonuclease/PAP phosphatase NrnA [Bacillota bacterium]
MPIQSIIETIQAYETIIIHRHERPDPDALGSQAGLKEIIQHSFPEKNVFIVGEEDPSLTFLVEMDHITDQQYDGALVIVCDTANTGRISDQRYLLGEKVIKIDHHPNNDPYGDILWVQTGASSTSEMIYTLYKEGQTAGLRLNDAGARLIYAGIVGDTGRFLFPSTTETTFSYATELIQYHFDRTALYDQMYEVDDRIARARGYVLQQYTISENGCSAVKITAEKLKELQLNVMETGQLVRVLGDIKGIKAWVFFIEESDTRIRVRLRSKGPIINTIAERFRGGGHPLASGATVHSWEEADALIAQLEAVCAE